MTGHRFRALIERHHPDLPVYCMVPPEIPAALGETRTFSAHGLLNDAVDLGRRGIKPWGDGRWFLELTKAQCDRAGVGEGNEVWIELTEAPALPEDLRIALDRAQLQAVWAARSASARRQMAEAVFAARRPETRAARVAKILAELEALQ